MPEATTGTRQDRCRACGASGPRVFHEVTGVPVHDTVLLPDRAQGLAFPTGDVRLLPADVAAL